MKNQTQIERTNKAKSRAEQEQLTSERLRKLALIEAHGSKNDVRKLELVISLFAHVARAPLSVRSAFDSFLAAARSRPFAKAFADLTARHPSFVKDRVALKMITEVVIRQQSAA